MQFFYIDYMNNEKKERNIGFLRVEKDGISVGLRGVPMQCGDRCRVYAVNGNGEHILMGEIAVKNGYGMEKVKWNDRMDFMQCMRIEIPLYGSRRGVCVLRDNNMPVHAPAQAIEQTGESIVKSKEEIKEETNEVTKEEGQAASCETNTAAEYGNYYAVKNKDVREETQCPDIYDEIHEDKWQQLLKIYPQVHICPDAQSIVIRPKDAVILTQQYHELATNSFVLHAYYNYRQLLLFRYREEKAGSNHTNKYYLGVPGVYYEREQRIAQMFGFEGFENGEARMQPDADNKIYRGCFGYYMKQVEI